MADETRGAGVPSWRETLTELYECQKEKKPAESGSIVEIGGDHS